MHHMIDETPVSKKTADAIEIELHHFSGTTFGSEDYTNNVKRLQRLTNKIVVYCVETAMREDPNRNRKELFRMARHAQIRFIKAEKRAYHSLQHFPVSCGEMYCICLANTIFKKFPGMTLRIEIPTESIDSAGFRKIVDNFINSYQQLILLLEGRTA